MNRPKIVEIRKALDVVMDQYQKAGHAYNVADTIDKAIWSMTIMDRCSAAIDALSYVLGEGGLEGQLTGECCNPFEPYVHGEEDKETEKELRAGYGSYIDDIKRLLKDE